MKSLRAVFFLTTGFAGAVALAMPSPLKFEAAPRPVVVAPKPLFETVRVRVAQIRASEFVLAGQDLVINGRPANGYHAYRFKKLTHPLRWTARNRDTDEDLRLPIDTSDATALHIRGHNVRLNLKPVPDEIDLEAHGGRASDVIAELDIESYLLGVLPAEMPASWPLEALKAQAIAARTFALYRKTHSNHEGFDVESDVMDQMFLHPTDEGGTKSLHQNTDRAILETQGMILEDRHHHPLAAYFHSDCGGHTEEAKDVWGAGEATGTAIDDGCPFNPKATWTLSLTLKQLSKALKSEVSDIAMGARTASGRLSELRLALADGQARAISGNDFRTALGFDQLKSTQFTMTRSGDLFVFKGRGYGHGVGLCQWGARQMAARGRSFKEILSHYYPKSTLQTTTERL